MTRSEQADQMTHAPTIMIVDDDAQIRDIIRIALERQGMTCLDVSSGQAALTEFGRQHIDLVVLDIGMPRMDGFEVCKALRARSSVPILFLTARDEEVERILGFELGADDFVGKPFSPREVMLRIKAILARGDPNAAKALRHGDLVVDAERFEAKLGEAPLSLTAKEFALLTTFLRHGSHVFDRNRLINAAYGSNAHLSGRTVDSHIRNIRAKAASLGYHDVIETVHGVGMRLGACVK